MTNRRTLINDTNEANKNILQEIYDEDKKIIPREIKKVSSEWIKSYGLEIVDPAGWDKNDFNYSFNKEKITQSEFLNRLNNSLCRRMFKNK